MREATGIELKTAPLSAYRQQALSRYPPRRVRGGQPGPRPSLAGDEAAFYSGTETAAAGELAQEARPEGLGLRRADIHPQNLAAAVRVHAIRNDDGDGDDTAVLTTSLQVGGVDPQIRPIAFKMNRAGFAGGRFV